MTILQYNTEFVSVHFHNDVITEVAIYREA